MRRAAAPTHAAALPADVAQRAYRRPARPYYIWRDEHAADEEGNYQDPNGSEGHVHPATLEEGVDYIITVWTPGNPGHDVRVSVEHDDRHDTLRRRTTDVSGGAATPAERAVVTFLFGRLQELLGAS
jgi:hypothetical protein